MILSRISRPNRRTRRCGRAKWNYALAALWSLSHAAAQDRPSPYGVSSRAVDGVSGDVWIGTLGEGLRRESAGRIDVFDQMNSGLPGNIVFSVAVGAGRVFAATNGGTCSFEPFTEQWELLEERRSDQPQGAFVELHWTTTGVCGRRWTGEIQCWDEAAHKWTSSREAWIRTEVLRIDDPRAMTALPPGTGHVSMAVLGPGTRRIALPGDTSTTRRPTPQPDLQAAQQAVAAVNKRIAPSGDEPFSIAEAAPGYARYGWGLLEDDLVAHARSRHVLGAVAWLDDRSSYTEASAAFLGIPLVSISDSPVVPAVGPGDKRWVFRCRGEESRAFLRFLDWLAGAEGGRHWTVVADDAHDEAAIRSAWVRGYAGTRGFPQVLRAAWSPDSVAALVDQIVQDAPDAVFLWVDAGHAADFVVALRSAGLTSRVVLGPDAVRAEFAARMGGTPGEIIAIPSAREGAARSSETVAPDELYLRTSAATDHLLSAMQRSSRDRENVRAALLEMEEDPFGERHMVANDSPAKPLHIARLTPRGWEREAVPMDFRANQP